MERSPGGRRKLFIGAAITPVPGGVGPMTVAMVLLNTVELAERQLGLA